MQILALILTILSRAFEIALVLGLASKFDAWGIASLYFAMRIAKVCAEILNEA